MSSVGVGQRGTMKSVARLLGTGIDRAAKPAHRQASPTSTMRVLGSHSDSTRAAQDVWSSDAVALERDFEHAVNREVFIELRRRLSNVIAGAAVRNRKQVLTEIN